MLTYWLPVIAVILVVIGILWQINNSLLVTVPRYGGTFIEGVVGTPRFINPVLASSSTDKDLTAIIYNGLVSLNKDGEIVPELAETYEISEDGRMHTFTLRDEIFFHDNTPITTEDVAFTISKVTDPLLKSPRRSEWEGVTVEIIDQKTIRFILEEPYNPFIYSTRIGILPKHIWGNADANEFTHSYFNQSPIGSGPYTIKQINRNNTGLPEFYRLSSFDKYVNGEAYIETIVFDFFTNEESLIEAFNKGRVNAIHGINTNDLEKISKKHSEITTPLLRTFGVFFSKKESSIFSNIVARKVLRASVDISDLVSQTIKDAVPTQTFIPVNTLNMKFEKDDPAPEIFDRNDWYKESNVWYSPEDKKLSFTIKTVDNPELLSVAQYFQSKWQELGAEVSIETFDMTNIAEKVIRPRDFELLLFGIDIGHGLSPFPFWHSSQRNDPGLNIVNFSDADVDKALEQAQATPFFDQKFTALETVENALREDVVGIPLYSPLLVYVTNTDIKGIHLPHIAEESERFTDIHKWYIYSNNVWSIFAPEHQNYQ